MFQIPEFTSFWHWAGWFLIVCAISQWRIFAMVSTRKAETIHGNAKA